MENQALSGDVSAILWSALILENIHGMFLLSIWATGTMYMDFDEKHSPNVLENQTRLQNTRKSLIFHLLCALFEQILSGINQDILKNPTWCGTKNSNKLWVSSHLVKWIPHTIFAFPTLSLLITGFLLPSLTSYFIANLVFFALLGYIINYILWGVVVGVGGNIPEKRELFGKQKVLHVDLWP